MQIVSGAKFNSHFSGRQFVKQSLINRKMKEIFIFSVKNWKGKLLQEAASTYDDILQLLQHIQQRFQRSA